MIRWIKSPSNPLIAKYVECYWCLDKVESELTIDHPKLNPDPTAHLIISHPNQKHQYQFENERLALRGSHWLYPHQHTYRMDHSGPLTIIGIKFQIGALYSISNSQTSPALNQIEKVDFEALFISTVFDEVEFLAAANNDADLNCDKLDELLYLRLSKVTQDKHADLVQRILPLLSTFDINQLGEELNSSQRTLERSFRRVTGLTMKQCQSIKRLDELLEFLYQREKQNIDWADIAYQFGFSDQPHLIRYLKNTIGSTPVQYANQRDLTIDIYGGIESL